MNILITGGAGYIGSHLSHLLSDKKINHVIVDNLSTGYKKLVNKRAKFYKVDISDKKKILKILKKNKITCIFHLAASILVSESMEKPEKYYFNNVIKLLDLIDVCSKVKIKNFVFSSTCAVYDDSLKKVDEKTPLKPKSIYGKTKLYGEQILKNFSKNYKFNYSTLRYFNVIGADSKCRTGQLNDSGHLFMNLSNSIIKKNYTASVYGTNYKTRDGSAVRDYIDVEDISNIHLSILEKMRKNNKSYEINCGSGKGFSVFEILSNFERVIGKKFKNKKLKRRPGDIEEIVADNKKLKKILNYKFNKNLSESIKTFIAWRKKFN